MWMVEYPFLQGRSRDTDAENRPGGTVGKEEGGVNSESSADTSTRPCMQRTAGGSWHTGRSAQRSVQTEKGGAGGGRKREGVYRQPIHLVYSKN